MHTRNLYTALHRILIAYQRNVYIYLLSHMIDLSELCQPVAVDHVVQNVHNNLHNMSGERVTVIVWRQYIPPMQVESVQYKVKVKRHAIV